MVKVHHELMKGLILSHKADCIDKVTHWVDLWDILPCPWDDDDFTKILTILPQPGPTKQ